MQVKIIGVEPSDANAMALSLYHGQRIMLEQVGGFMVWLLKLLEKKHFDCVGNWLMESFLSAVMPIVHPLK